MALHTRICAMLGIHYPILLAGMGRASTPELAAAVSNAGGLGVIGAASCGPNQLRDWIRRTRALTDKPFGVDTLLPASVRRGGRAKRRPLGRGAAAAAPGLRPRLPGARGTASAGPGDPRPVGWTATRPTWTAPPRSPEAFFEAQMEVVIEERVPSMPPASAIRRPGWTG